MNLSFLVLSQFIWDKKYHPLAPDGGMSQEELWHGRYGHLGVQNMRKLVAEEMVDGLDCKMSKDIGVCKPCVITVVLSAVTQCWG